MCNVILLTGWMVFTLGTRPVDEEGAIETLKGRLDKSPSSLRGHVAEQSIWGIYKRLGISIGSLRIHAVSI